MTDKRWKRITKLFCHPLEMEEEERHHWLEEQCRDDRAIIEEVRSLLDAFTPEGPLNKPIHHIRKLAFSDLQQQWKGKTIGAYTILELIGAGGMGMVHRDIKPANIMNTHDGMVKILDFGIAKAADLGLTLADHRPGTVAYMVLEQAKGGPVDHRADIWSLGIMLYEMLTGRHPLKSGNGSIPAGPDDAPVGTRASAMPPRTSTRNFPPDAPWTEAGITPLENFLFPRGNIRWRAEKEGYEIVYPHKMHHSFNQTLIDMQQRMNTSWTRNVLDQNRIRAGFLVFAFCTILITSRDLSAQSSPFVIPKLNGPVTLDGRVDEPAWQAIEPLPLVTHWPSFGDPVLSSQTKLRIAHDKEYLYVSCVCYDDSENVVAATYKRDEINPSISNISIILDTFHDSENALWFAVTPTGSRVDAAIGNDGASINIAWNTIWEAKAVITDFGWTAEMRIPFSSLRFESRDGRVEMGLIASRYKAHSTTLHIFPAIPPDWGFNSWSKVSQAAGIVLHDVENRMPVFITPYLLAGGERAAFRNPDGGSFSHDSDLALEAGLDVKMGVTNNTTLDLTINTDFAQVEADDQQVNLSRFSLFFPEQRQFFLERASVFNFSFGGADRLFHSRRIGLHEGQQVRILGGARTITRSRGWDLGLLSMQTARDHGLLSKNHSVVRVRKQLFNPQSYGGGLLTSRIDESGNYDLSVGLDGIFNIRGDDFLDINLAQTIRTDMNTTLTDSESLRFRGVWERRRFQGLSYAFSFNYSGELYEPAMGFQLRNNYKQIGDRVSWGWIPDDSSLRNIRVSMIGTAYLRNTDGSLETSRFGPSVELTWRRDDFFSAEILVVTEDLLQPFQLSDDAGVPAGNYRFTEAFASYHTPRGKPLRVVFSAGGGGFFDGERFTGSISNTWDPSRVINLNLFYQFNSIRFADRDQSFDAHIARFRTEFTFNTRLTLSSFIQYNSAGDIGILNARLRYNPRDGNNFYIVFNETANTNRDRLTPRLPFSDHRAVLLKFDYTF